MSEHRGPRAKVIPFPGRDDEGWPLDKMTERLEHLNWYVEYGHLPIDALFGAAQESFELLVLYWAGLPPRGAEELVERLAPRWGKLREMEASNRARATAMLKS
jgi:hypothetical protein